MKQKTFIIIMYFLTNFCQLFAQVREIEAKEFFYSLLPKMSKPIVIDFWAEWCGPCHRYTPIFMSVAREYKNMADFYRVNVDKNEEWCTQWEIESIPTTIVIYNKGCDFLRQEGILDEENLHQIIDKSIKKNRADKESYF